MRPNVVLEDGVLEGLFNDNSVLEELPFLKNAAAAKSRVGGCVPCGKKAVNYNGLKMAIVGLPPDKVAFLKNKLNTSTITVIYNGANGTQEANL